MSPPQSQFAASSPRLPWLRRSLSFALAGYWLLIFILTHTPAPDLPRVPVNDKLEHFLAYGLLGGLLYLTAWSRRPNWNRLGWFVWIIGLSYGAIDEWLQLLVGRDCELNDWLADAAAVTIAVLVLSLVRHVVRRRQANPSARFVSIDTPTPAAHNSTHR
jgi:VanZ family protein